MRSHVNASSVVVLVAACALASCAARNPVAIEPSKEAQLAMLKDEGYYAEEEKDGRFYVFAQQKTHDEFRRTGHLQVAKTFVGAGPGGATVRFEAKDKFSELTERIISTFNAQHGTSLR